MKVAAMAVGKVTPMGVVAPTVYGGSGETRSAKIAKKLFLKVRGFFNGISGQSISV